MLTRFHNELESMDMRRLTGATGWGEDRVRLAIAQLRHLDPSPLGIKAPLLSHELSMMPMGAGVSLKVFKENIQSISLNNPENPKGLVKDLISKLLGRRRVLALIGLLISSRQIAFLSGDQEYLEPQTASEIAKVIGLATSTISRCTNSTYTITRIGTIRPLDLKSIIKTTQIQEWHFGS